MPNPAPNIFIVPMLCDTRPMKRLRRILLRLDRNLLHGCLPTTSLVDPPLASTAPTPRCPKRARRSWRRSAACVPTDP
eukprot:4394161-Pleurochrysis_carterae.AAC.3